MASSLISLVVVFFAGSQAGAYCLSGVFKVNLENELYMVGVEQVKVSQGEAKVRFSLDVSSDRTQADFTSRLMNQDELAKTDKGFQPMKDFFTEDELQLVKNNKEEDRLILLTSDKNVVFDFPTRTGRAPGNNKVRAPKLTYFGNDIDLETYKFTKVCPKS